MRYRFIGKLCGLICPECPEPLANVQVRLYRHRKGQDVTSLAVATAKDTLAILSDKDVKAKASSLLAEARTDDAGNFAFTLGDDDGYDGEAFELDVYVEKVPGKNGKSDPVQFTITTIQPRFKQTPDGLVAVFEYCIPKRFWCGVRALFDAWAICGRVTTCETQAELAGVTVTAFDTDWTQDDELGSAVTDSSGKFRIDYTSADFKKTPFSPFINVELFGGPDLYFKIEGAGGTVLLQEPRSRGRDADREDVGQCFCVELCVDVEEPPPFEHPWFTHVGDFHVLSHFDVASGKTTTGVLGHSGPGFGFHGALKLKGFCPKTAPGGSAPMRYRFLYEHPSNPGIEVPVTGVAAVAPVVVGSRLLQWDLDGSGPAWTTQSIVVAGKDPTPAVTPVPAVPPGTPWGPVPEHVIVPDANGWVAVDPTSLDGGFFGPLIRFRSQHGVPGGAAPGDGAGTAVADPKNGVAIKIIFEAEPIAGGAPSFRDELSKIFVNNWGEVRQVNLEQFVLAGSACTPLSSALNILYTADHELMRDWSVSITTAASVPGGIPPLPSGSVPRGGVGNHFENITAWPSCSYRVHLTTRRMLTDGEHDDDADTSTVTFCK